MFKRKPLNYEQYVALNIHLDTLFKLISSRQDSEERLERHFSFWSLLAFGVGGTVGSGILVLSGRIAV